MSDTLRNEENEQKTPEEVKKEAKNHAFFFTAAYVSGYYNSINDDSFLDRVKCDCETADINYEFIKRYYLDPSKDCKTAMKHSLDSEDNLKCANTIAEFLQDTNNKERLIRKRESIWDSINNHLSDWQTSRNKIGYASWWYVLIGLGLVALAYLIFTSGFITNLLVKYTLPVIGIIGLLILVICIIRGKFGLLWGYLFCVAVGCMVKGAVIFFTDDMSATGFFRIIQFIFAIPVALIGIYLIYSYIRDKSLYKEVAHANKQFDDAFKEAYMITYFSFFEPFDMTILENADPEASARFISGLWLVRDFETFRNGMRESTLTTEYYLDLLASCLSEMYDKHFHLPIITKADVTEFFNKTSILIQNGKWLS